VIDDRAEQRAVDVHTGVEAAVLEHRLSGVGATDGVPVDADTSAAQAAGASHGVEVRDDVTLVGDAPNDRSRQSSPTGFADTSSPPPTSTTSASPTWSTPMTTKPRLASSVAGATWKADGAVVVGESDAGEPDGRGTGRLRRRYGGARGSGREQGQRHRRP
jgi:hypothetical protein